MQKTFLKFVVFELIERISRFRLLLDETADQLHERAPQLHRQMLVQARHLEETLLSQKSALNKLFTDGASASSKQVNLPETLIHDTYNRLCQLSQVLARFKPLDVAPETFLFLKDILPEDLTRNAGEQSVFLAPEGESGAPFTELLPQVLLDTLSVLQKNNPLAWLSLTRSFTKHLLESASSLESLKLDILKTTAKSPKNTAQEEHVEAVLRHALNLRLLGPAYYFHALSEAVFRQDSHFLHVAEPALFFGLNHQNFTHKSLVILHEACERSKPGLDNAPLPLSEDQLANVYRAIENVIPTKFAFQAKQLDRAVQLQERISQGTLLSSSPLYPVEEVSETLNKTRAKADFSIYGPLSMMTEYPHGPREIVNAGWLYKVERGPVWLYSALNEEGGQGFERVLELLDYQDSLLRKSIEVSEVHRVLLCSR